MISTEMLASKIDRLPEELQREVLDFMQHLIEKHQDTVQDKSRRIPTFGSCKGRFVIPSDLDEPLEDFQEYME